MRINIILNRSKTIKSMWENNNVLWDFCEKYLAEQLHVVRVLLMVSFYFILIKWLWSIFNFREISNQSQLLNVSVLFLKKSRKTVNTFNMKY